MCWRGSGTEEKENLGLTCGRVEPERHGVELGEPYDVDHDHRDIHTNDERCGDIVTRNQLNSNSKVIWSA